MKSSYRGWIKLLVMVALLAVAPCCLANTYYVNCSSATNGTGSATNPWNTLTAVTGATFLAGDSILLNRGTTCTGPLAPLGSGSSGVPIMIDAYGTGAQPVVQDIASDDAAVSLTDQQYWEIRNLEVIGGRHYGVHITQTILGEALNHVYLTNLNVHGASYVSTSRMDSGEVVIDAATAANTNTWNDIVINGVEAHDSKVSQGIYVVAATGKSTPAYGSDITVENSTVSRVYGDGLLVRGASNVLIQGNVVSESGTCPGTCGTSTPGGLWVFQCSDCIMQSNESYANQTFADSDGGDFDIDYLNTNVTLQYNYGHDSYGYCFSVFGGSSSLHTTNSIARYNVCANNERSNAYGKPAEGDVFLSTWNSGSLDGVQIYNNTFYWNPNPSLDSGVLYDAGASFASGYVNLFENNLIYSTTATMVYLPYSTGLSMKNNLYYTISSDAHVWQYGSTAYTSMANYQSTTGQDAGSFLADPAMNNPGYHQAGVSAAAFTLRVGSPAVGAGLLVAGNGGRDFFNNAVSSTTAPNVGAYNGPGTDPGNLVSNPGFESGALGAWSPWNTVSIGTTDPHNGYYDVVLGANSSAEQVISGLLPSTTYTFGGWARNDSTSESVRIGVKNYGGSEIYYSLSGTSSGYGSVTFTTGSSSTQATVYAYHATSSGLVYADDLSLHQDLVANPGFETGAPTPWTESNATLVSSPVHSGVEAMQISNGGSTTQAITGLTANTQYVLSGYAQETGSTTAIQMGVDNQGGSQIVAPVTSTSFAPYALNFTTGATNTGATIFLTDTSGSGLGVGDDFVVTPNQLINPDFEWGVTGPWSAYGNYSITNSNQHSGSYGLELSGSDAGAEQILTGLAPNTHYVLSGWLKSDTTGDAIRLGVKNYGGTEVYSSGISSVYSWYVVGFTTGAANISADLYLYKPSGSGNAYADDLTLSRSVE
jgi:hypothetical protein